MLTTEIIKWTDFDRLEFQNERFDNIDLTSIEQSNNFDFNTELIFKNCKIGNIGDTIKVYTKKISFIACELGNIWFYGTCFSGGLEMKNCSIKDYCYFNAIGYNLDPNAFIIDSCVFNDFADFFDCYFEGPVKITNNDFRHGTNIGIYLKPPFGIKDSIEFIIENNRGDISRYADNDPVRPR